MKLKGFRGALFLFYKNKRPKSILKYSWGRNPYFGKHSCRRSFSRKSLISTGIFRRVTRLY